MRSLSGLLEKFALGRWRGIKETMERMPEWVRMKSRDSVQGNCLGQCQMWARRGMRNALEERRGGEEECGSMGPWPWGHAMG